MRIVTYECSLIVEGEICADGLELCLPGVSMGMNEARTDDG